MTRKYTLLFLSLLLITNLSAQITGLGIRAGGHFSRQYFDVNSTSRLDDALQDLAPDFQFGVFTNIQMSEYTDIVPAFSYIRKPYQENYFVFEDTAKDFKVEQKLVPRWDYLSFDLPFRFHKKNENTLMYMFLGLRFDYLINTKEIVVQDSSLYDSFYRDFKKFSVGYIAGLGAEYTLNENWNILIEFTYNRDITNIYSKENLRIKAEVMALTIGLKFKTVKQGRVTPYYPDPDDDYYEEEEEY